MVRSAAAVLAVLILPGFALAQQAPGTHTVILDDTLWDLAQRYYEDPFEWRVIWNANRGVVEDPNLIYPEEVLVIPGLPGTGDQVVAEVPGGEMTEPVAEDATVAPAPAGPAMPTMPGAFRQARPSEGVRTVFFTDTASAGAGVVRNQDVSYIAVPRDQVFSAPWLIREFEGDPEHEGVVEGFANREERASTIRSYSRVRVNMDGGVRVGALLQTYRVYRTIEDVGRVVIPTGVISVSAIGEDGVIGVLTKEYGRVQPGDFVRAVPNYSISPGERAQSVTGGTEAMVMGFAGPAGLVDSGTSPFSIWVRTTA